MEEGKPAQTWTQATSHEEDWPSHVSLRWWPCLALCSVHPRAFALRVTMQCYVLSMNGNQCVVVVNVLEAICIYTLVLRKVH